MNGAYPMFIWLEFVVACRKGIDKTNYDIVEGGVANDQVIDTVEDYENGRITAEQALDQLKYQKPNNQICFRNQEVIDKYILFKYPLGHGDRRVSRFWKVNPLCP